MAGSGGTALQWLDIIAIVAYIILVLAVGIVVSAYMLLCTMCFWMIYQLQCKIVKCRPCKVHFCSNSHQEKAEEI